MVPSSYKSNSANIMLEGVLTKNMAAISERLSYAVEQSRFGTQPTPDHQIWDGT